MAEVWLAEPVTTWHRYPYVVLKRVHAHLSEEQRLRRMFLDEARLAARLNHPNIVRVLDVGELDDELYMVMELIDGLDLRACMDLHQGPLWPAFAAALVADACAGLHYAHTLKSLEGKPMRVVHRDIAPDNLMVDVEGRVRLVDFGVARADTTEVTTQTGLRKGKARYMSPEYLLEHEATPKSDVYSMAATLFELVTGQKPHGDLTSPPNVIAAIVQHGLPRADTVRPSLPAPLVQIIADASMHDVKKRLPSARALEERLRGFLDNIRPPPRADIDNEVALWKKKRGVQL
jgi:serine/threonine-protein kinase